MAKFPEAEVAVSGGGGGEAGPKPLVFDQCIQRKLAKKKLRKPQHDDGAAKENQ